MQTLALRESNTRHDAADAAQGFCSLTDASIVGDSALRTRSARLAVAASPLARDERVVPNEKSDEAPSAILRLPQSVKAAPS
jgi:hypothetical protein